MSVKFAIGQDSHKFETDPEKLYSKPLILGGICFGGMPCLSANSDGDVVLHALTNAVSGITCRNILGKPADDMCKRGITDSAEYLKLALKDLRDMHYKATHVSFTIEAAVPKFSPKIDEMRRNIEALLELPENSCGITATTGEGLTAFGQGLGIMVFCVLTAEAAGSPADKTEL